MLLFIKWKDKFKIDSNFIKDFLKKLTKKEFENKFLFFENDQWKIYFTFFWNAKKTNGFKLKSIIIKRIW